MASATTNGLMSKAHFSKLESFTVREWINWLPNATLYIGGANAADKDPRTGWGFSASQPFATFDYARNALMNYYLRNGLVNVILQADLTWDHPYPWLMPQNFAQVSFYSASTSAIRTLTLPKGMTVFSGQVQFSNIRLNFAQGGSGVGIQVNGSYRGYAPTLLLGSGCALNGACGIVIQCINNGSVFINANLAANVTGQRYNCCNGGRIFANGRGLEAIPGTSAGYCDSTSVYA